jgi:prophage regulatory protein
MAKSSRRGQADAHPICILRLPAVISRVGLSRSSIYARMNQGTFPQPVQLGPRAIGFVESEISSWLDAAVEQRTLRH